MSKARFPIEQVDPPPSPKETLLTMYDLPSVDPEEAGLPDEYHLWQCELCSATFAPPTYSPDQVFVASDLNLYYDSQHTGSCVAPPFIHRPIPLTKFSSPVT